MIKKAEELKKRIDEVVGDLDAEKHKKLANVIEDFLRDIAEELEKEVRLREVLEWKRDHLGKKVVELKLKLAILESTTPGPHGPPEHDYEQGYDHGYEDDENLPELIPVDYSEVYIERDAMRKMLGHCSSMGNKKLEALGFLLGDHYVYEGFSYTVVKEVVTSRLDSSAVSVRISDFKPMFAEMDRLERAGKEYVLVGWYHSHPGMTCFLSGTDVRTQKRMFREKHHVAVVVDPLNRELKVFKLDPEKEYREISYAVFS